MLTPIPAPITIDYSQWPTAAHVVGQLIGGNYWPSDADQREQNFVAATAAIASVVAEFERRTGWYPFFANPAPAALAETRTFDAANLQGTLELDGGLLDLQSVTIGGTAYTRDTNVFLRPSNATAYQSPYTALHFPYGGAQSGAVTPLPNAIAVTGRWGRVRVLPPDVWFAALRWAQVLTLTSGNQDQDVVSWGKNGFSEALDTVGVIDPKTVLNYLPKEFEAAVARWKRVIV